MAGPFAVAVMLVAAVSSGVAHGVDNGLYAGYIAYAGHYRGVSAEWTEPTVSCAPGERSAASFWVGLDGYGTADLEQLGTAVDCYDGVPAYSAWYEWLPAPSVVLDRHVAAGDRFAASVVADDDGHFTMTLTDVTQRWTETVSDTITNAPLSSAEIVAEPPTVGGGPLPLANFDTVTFADVRVNGAPLAASTIGRTEVSIDGGPVATATTPLGDDGASFTIRWLNHGR